MNKRIILGVMGLMLVGCVEIYANSNTEWSNPFVGSPEPTSQPKKVDCPREEWNQMFSDYREGLISKEDMKIYVRSCN